MVCRDLSACTLFNICSQECQYPDPGSHGARAGWRGPNPWLGPSRISRCPINDNAHSTLSNSWTSRFKRAAWSTMVTIPFGRNFLGICENLWHFLAFNKANSERAGRGSMLEKSMGNVNMERRGLVANTLNGPPLHSWLYFQIGSTFRSGLTWRIDIRRPSRSTPCMGRCKVGETSLCWNYGAN